MESKVEVDVGSFVSFPCGTTHTFHVRLANPYKETLTYWAKLTQFFEVPPEWNVTVPSGGYDEKNFTWTMPNEPITMYIFLEVRLNNSSGELVFPYQQVGLVWVM